MNHYNTVWNSSSWKKKEALQQPIYKCEEAVQAAEQKLRNYPPLVAFDEIDALKSDLAKVEAGEAFLLQAGDCAESFSEFAENSILDTFRVILQMALIITFGGKKPVVKMGRMAGQFAKPRSQETEAKQGLILPSYKGDIVNGLDFSEASREADPERMIRSYFQSSATLNFVRSLAGGGYSALENMNQWLLDFLKENPIGEGYRLFAEKIKEAIVYMRSCNRISQTQIANANNIDFYTCHEALLLPYEEALVRRNSLTGGYYCTSGHFLWIGDRTRQVDGAHIEFIRGLENPVGIKCGPSMTPEDLLRLLDVIDPNHEEGKISLISRMGEGNIDKCLLPLINALKMEGRSAIWVCDPMHGNTRISNNGYKTRLFENIYAELNQFNQLLCSLGVHPGGMHIEMTGKNVTECLGGSVGISEDDLPDRYDSACDPRLNAAQSLELAFLVAEVLENSK